jgi:hypothetical protein
MFGSVDEAVPAAVSEAIISHLRCEIILATVREEPDYLASEMRDNP